MTTSKVQAAEKAYLRARVRASKALAVAKRAFIEARHAAEEAYNKAIQESEK